MTSPNVFLFDNYAMLSGNVGLPQRQRLQNTDTRRY